MKLERRPYAEAAIRHLRAALPEHRRVLAVSPTGSGKTVIAAQIINREKRWRRVLWLAHRYELVDQAYDTLRSLRVDAGVCMASDAEINGTERHNPDARVIVGSVQTITARGVPDGVDLIVFDEAHRTMADSYQSIAAAAPDAEILGITATPVRLDGKGLGDFYRHMHVIAQPSALHRADYLARPRTYSAPPGVLARLVTNLRGARSRGGDYAPADLARAIDRRYLIGHIVEESKRLAHGVPKVAFACNVAHSKRIADSFTRSGIKAAHIDGETPLDDRRAILAALRSGDLEVVSNVDVLSEGWDLPSLGAVIIARPTKSIGRFLQMAGRVQRPYRGRVPIVIDHGANVQRLDVVPGGDHDWSLADRLIRHRSTDGRSLVKVCPGCLSCIPQSCKRCPDCDSIQPDRVLTEREEIAARLEEVKIARVSAQRERVETLARSRGYSDAWVAEVMRIAQ